MTDTELEVLILALPPAEAWRLIRAVAASLVAGGGSGQNSTDVTRAVRELGKPYIAPQGGSEAMEAQVQLLLEKFANLSPEGQEEVGDFIEFLHLREKAQLSARDFSRAADRTFAQVWDNDDDAVYDKL